MSVQQQSFFCANGTLFDQKTQACSWWYNVNCDSSNKQLIDLNNSTRTDIRTDLRTDLRTDVRIENKLSTQSGQSNLRA